MCDRWALPVLAVDVFDKFNFTGARVPRFGDVHEEFPWELDSSVSFPADFFSPPEHKGKAAGAPAACELRAVVGVAVRVSTWHLGGLPQRHFLLGGRSAGPGWW